MKSLYLFRNTLRDLRFTYNNNNGVESSSKKSNGMNRWSYKGEGIVGCNLDKRRVYDTTPDAKKRSEK